MHVKVHADCVFMQAIVFAKPENVGVKVCVNATAVACNHICDGMNTVTWTGDRWWHALAQWRHLPQGIMTCMMLQYCPLVSAT